MKINVTKTFLPPIEEYQEYLKSIWESAWLTNNGPLLVQLENNLKNYIQTDNFNFVSNGTIALQLAIKALELKGEIITTPFSYCATTTAILWENSKPIFVDVNENDLNIDANKIEEAITKNTVAILATHVYGLPCDVEKIEQIALKYNLKVIYDAAHAFGVTFNQKSLLNFGDISTCSFHATKVFHTIEGGGVICKNKEIHDKISLLKSFGHIGDDYFMAGINGKNSEFHAAMGLCNLKHLSKIILDRKMIFQRYDNELEWTDFRKPSSYFFEYLEYNYAYYPIIFDSEISTLKVITKLNEENIFPRRYFYPSLNKMPYLKETNICPISESIATRVIALPLYPDLPFEMISKISRIINHTIKA